VAIGVAGLGAVLEHRVSSSLASTHQSALAQAVSSSGEQVARAHSSLAHTAGAAFASGLNAALLTGCVTVFVSAVAAIVLMRVQPARAGEQAPAAEHA
jgi:hypothetical protein